MFLDVLVGIHFAGSDTGCGTNRLAKENIQIIDNFITVKNAGSDPTYGIITAGFTATDPGGNGVARPLTNVVVKDNIVMGAGSGAITAGLYVQDARKNIDEDNVLDSNGGWDFYHDPTSATFSSVRNNKTLAGTAPVENWFSDEQEQKIVFVPTSGVGWYRLTTAGACCRSSGNVRIHRDVFDTTAYVDLEFDYAMNGYSSDGTLGDINLLRCQDVGALIVDEIRIGNDSSTTVIYLDIHVTQAPANVPITITSSAGKYRQFLSTPLFLGNPGTPPPNVKSLALGRGLRTTGRIYAGGANTQLTDDAGKVRAEALNVVGTAQGGLAGDFSTLPADRLLYTATTANFVQWPFTSIGRDLVDSTSQQDARENALGLVISSGDLTGSYPNPTLRNAAQTSVIGRSANSSGAPADTVASGDGQYLRTTAGTLAFGSINAAHITSGLVGSAQLGNGTASSSTFLRGDQTWASVPIVVMKTVSETNVNDAVLSDDAMLKFTMAANTKYTIRLKVFFTTAAFPDFKYRVTGPASPTLVRRHITRAAGGNPPTMLAIGTAYDSADVPLAGPGAEGIIDEEIIVHNGGTQADFKFQWAQNTSNGTATIVRAGSYIEYVSF